MMCDETSLARAEAWRGTASPHLPHLPPFPPTSSSLLEGDNDTIMNVNPSFCILTTQHIHKTIVICDKIQSLLENVLRKAPTWEFLREREIGSSKSDVI